MALLECSLPLPPRTCHTHTCTHHPPQARSVHMAVCLLLARWHILCFSSSVAALSISPCLPASVSPGAQAAESPGGAASRRSPVGGRSRRRRRAPGGAAPAFSTRCRAAARRGGSAGAAALVEETPGERAHTAPRSPGPSGLVRGSSAGLRAALRWALRNHPSGSLAERTWRGQVRPASAKVRPLLPLEELALATASRKGTQRHLWKTTRRALVLPQRGTRSTSVADRPSADIWLRATAEKASQQSAQRSDGRGRLDLKFLFTRPAGRQMRGMSRRAAVVVLAATLPTAPLAWRHAAAPAAAPRARRRGLGPVGWLLLTAPSAGGSSWT